MKKYYAHFYKDFGNTYNLYYTESEADEALLPEGAQRITRENALRLAADEAAQRKNDPSFSGYADAYIFPADYDRSDNHIAEIICGWNKTYWLNGRIVERRHER